MATVAVDFDGVIHAYSKGWQDGSIYDEPLPLAFESLRGLMREYAVFVHTTRDAHAVAEWIQVRSGIPCAVQVNPDMEFWNVQGELLVTNRKLPAVAYIDDRAIRFVDWVQAMTELAAREPPKRPKGGLDRVREAVRQARGGDPPAQIRGYA